MFNIDNSVITSKKIPHSSFYLFLLLFVIFLDEIIDNFFLGIFNDESIIRKIVFYGIFLLLQIIASPIQAGYSDYHCRKRSLIASLSCSAISLIFIFFYQKAFFLPTSVLLIATTIKALFGNTLPLAWAGIADMRDKNYRFSLGLSTTVIALGYLAKIGISDFFGNINSTFIILVLFISIIPVFWFKFFDLIDRKQFREAAAAELNIYNIDDLNKIQHIIKLILYDFKSIWNNFIKDSEFRTGLFGVFLPLEISFYSTHSLGVDLAIKSFKAVTIFMILGYLAGVLILKRLGHKNDEALISFGYKISISSFVPIFLMISFLNFYYLKWIIAICFFVYSFGVAFIVPSLFSTISRKRELTDQGKIYGLLDSADTIALLVAIIAGIIYTIFGKPIYIVGFSCILFLISRGYYGQFYKIQKNRSS